MTKNELSTGFFHRVDKCEIIKSGKGKIMGNIWEKKKRKNIDKRAQ